MKTILFFILFGFALQNNTFAQDSVSCYTDKSIHDLYDKFENSNTKHQTIDSIAFVFKYDRLKNQQFYDWAKINGYTSEFCIPANCKTEIEKHNKDLKISKKIDAMNYDLFSLEIKKVDKKRLEYGIVECGGLIIK